MGRRKDPGKTATAASPPARSPVAGAGAGAGAGRAATARPEKAFDVWLDRGLHSLFDGVAAEPIPEDLLRLIEEDRKK